MILTKELEIFVHNTKVKYYRNLGYEFKCGGSIIKILIEHLPKGSHSRIDVKCDFCGLENCIRYEKYIINTNRNGGFYSCIKCRANNTRKTKQQKYGDEKYCNKNKIKETLLKNMEKILQ